MAIVDASFLFTRYGRQHNDHCQEDVLSVNCLLRFSGIFVAIGMLLLAKKKRMNAVAFYTRADYVDVNGDDRGYQYTIACMVRR